VVLNPDRLRALKLPHAAVVEAITKANSETGGSVVELAEAEYMVRAPGYLSSVDDFRKIPVVMSEGGTPVLLGDVATIQVGPEMRRGIAELNGQGEVVGGVIVMRSGKNALQTIDAVKAKLESLKPSLPPGVEIVETYDRASLIERAIANLWTKLAEEFAVVALVCVAFLWSLRSSLVAVATLPIGILMAFIVMHWQGINANILSLSGIAIAIGAMVDAAIVMIENAHRRLEQWEAAHGGEPPGTADRWKVVTEAAVEVGPAVFFSLIIITLSFVPVFALEAQEGRLFHPLAFTKTYAMAASAILAVTLVPVLMGWLISGRVPAERKNPLNRALIRFYEPQIRAVLKAPWVTIAIAAVLVVVSA
ncbi:MAG: efflux RND transporter permease subunit, partial [Burkholderiaceae bacterium]